MNLDPGGIRRARPDAIPVGSDGRRNCLPAARSFRARLLGVAVVGIAGCAVRYYDESTGVEHVWGVGHMRMKVTPPSEGVRAVVTDSGTLGAGLHLNDPGTALTLGWHRSGRLRVLDSNAAVRLEWPSASLFSVRVGTAPPRHLLESETTPPTSLPARE